MCTGGKRAWSWGAVGGEVKRRDSRRVGLMLRRASPRGLASYDVLRQIRARPIVVAALGSFG